jgi:hypothetical protein
LLELLNITSDLAQVLLDGVSKMVFQYEAKRR